VPVKVWDGSAWTEVGKLSVWNGSSWVPVVNASAWNGSAWAKFFPAVKVSDNTALNLSKSGVGGTAAATYRFASSGQASATNAAGTLTNISGEWLVGSGTTSDYEVRATVLSGSGGSFSGPGAGWHNLGTTRDWSLTVTNNAGDRDVLMEIRIAATSLVIASATITFEVDSAP
jgi:hypothetical protein